MKTKTTFLFLRIAPFVICLASLTAGCKREVDTSKPVQATSPVALDERQTEPSGGFSFSPPKGWTFREFPGLKYKIATGQPLDGFAPNINFVEESAAVSLSDYAEANLRIITKQFKGVKKISQSSFKTEAGASAIMIAVESDQFGKRLRQTFFFFDGKENKKFVATCSVLASSAAELDPLFMASMKTFSLTQ